jgi:hypothetical protein
MHGVTSPEPPLQTRKVRRADCIQPSCASQLLRSACAPGRLGFQALDFCFRGDADRGFVFGGLLSVSQSIGLIMVVVASAVLIVRHRSSKSTLGLSKMTDAHRTLITLNDPMF